MGVEPTTSCVEDRDSSQLSYRRIKIGGRIVPLTARFYGRPRKRPNWWTHTVLPRGLRIASALCYYYHYEPISKMFSLVFGNCFLYPKSTDKNGVRCRLMHPRVSGLQPDALLLGESDNKWCAGRDLHPRWRYYLLGLKGPTNRYYGDRRIKFWCFRRESRPLHRVKGPLLMC